ncbi:MAG: beta galactosidase jelly roll domain-containing protein, partial [Actinomycetota bacterium]|nr:beta galactosidase jelly roll domain-containing protein [Actinomycetota bacterium]
DTSTSGPLSVWAGPAITSVYWDGAPVAVQRQADGSLAGTVPGPAPVMLPVLTGWKFAYGAPEAQPGFNDSNWTLADHPVSNAGSPSTPVLYASDYGYGYGFVWYRGHFMATGNETGVKLTVDGVAPTGAYSAWLNGAFLGSAGAAGPSTTTFTFPAGSVKAGKDNVIAILVENTDNPEGPSGEKVGLYSASLVGSSQPITWRLKGADPVLQDPVRGIMNAAGLYGSEHGWDLPGYPDGNWTPVTLPDSWAARGVPAGIGWYRTTFNLHLPPDQYVPVAVQIGGPGPSAGTANYRAFIYVNGWLIGRYVNNVGPQHQFYVPAGILNDNGLNTIAIADWGLDEMTGGLAQVSLVALGNQLSSLQVQPVASPGYNPAVYGPPTPPVPTLGVVPSTALAEGSFTVTATLTNPTHAPLTDAAIGLSVPSGWTLTSDASTLTSNAGTLTSDAGTVAPRSARSVQFFVTAPASGLTPGTVGLLTVATFGSGPPARFGPLGRQFGPPGDGRGNRSETIMNAASLSVPYPDLASTFNNTGVTDNSDPNPYPGFIGFDGGGTSYSAQGLAADGITPGATVSAGGLSFTWPDVAVATPDNTMAEGQIIALTGAGTTLGFLAAANNSPESGTGTVYYTDGTSQSFTLDVGNFWYPSGQDGNPENVTVASVNYANYKTGSSGHTIYLFEQSVALETGKTVEAVRLPALGSVTGYEPALHVFALSIGG